MKILFSSHLFAPSTGGIESSSLLLAREFARAGHEVRLITQTPGSNETEWPYQVIRRPREMELLRLVRWCDVFFHNNISLRSVWPLLLARRPWVVAHQIWLAHLDGQWGWREKLKARLLRFATNVSISQAVADKLGVPSVVIGNPFDEEVFGRTDPPEKRSGLVFLGRLVSDKGVDILIRALAILSGQGVAPKLTLIGAGPEEHNLRRLVRELGLSERVRFAGLRKGAALVDLLNHHQILVMPSRWEEPFGIAALEGIACGCVVVGSEGGGLPEAIGPCGVTFPNGDAEALAGVLRELLEDGNARSHLLSMAPAHLAAHTGRAVAASYLSVFGQLSTRNGRS